MKNIIKHSLVYLILIMLILYFATIGEGIENLGLRNYNFIQSIKYFLLWIIPYWWLMLIISSIILAIITNMFMLFKSKKS